ncbi:hypothetical protein [Amycolatopsis sp. NPDC021455]|uniref:hypothetical protein n=1 Tax=Amycolatopsis sp. NPDC021455 TaxID=3154901 RepID=UPI0033C4558A
MIERADALHLRAPELALVLGERAAALSEAAGADEQWIRAESLVVSARVRLGERPGTVGRAVAALRAAEHAGYGDIAARLRIDLAVCARSLGVPLTGLAALRPVLTDPVVSPVHRAAALCHLVGCLAQLGRKAELDRVLVEADKLVLGDDSLGADTQLLVRALLRVGTAAHRRRHGDLTAAADAARTGLGFLEKLDNPADDGGLVRIRLVLLLVSTLLDRGDTEMAYEIAEPMLAEPVRAAGVAPMGWLRLAVATRIHLPAGAGEAAIELVREAVASTDRHGLCAVTARLWLELAQLQERFGQAEEAIACLYRSRAAEQLHARARRQACSVLAGEFGTGEPASVDLDEVLKAVPSGATPRAGGSAARAPESSVPSGGSATRTPEVPSRPDPAVAAEPVTPPGPPRSAPLPAAAPEPAPRTPAWSFGREEPPSRPQPAPAWSFERPRVTADAAETTLMPAVRDEPAPPKVRPPEPRVRPEPVAAERRPEPPQARQPVEERSAPKPEPEVRPVGKRSREPEPVVRPPERRPDAAEARPPERRPEPAPAPAPEIGKTKFSWAALAEARLRETAAERESAPTRVTPALPLAPEPAAEREPWDAEERRRREPQPSTRHDAEHGSEAARSVLDRLGISASGGAGGGRRRAEDAERPRAEEPARPEPELAPPPRPEDEPPSVPDYRDEAEPWLPRLRMPPTLEPMEDFGHWTPATAPFPESYARAISEDEPPPDAGLADLLARALAEHQAGTASAAALVKQLGSQDSGRRNGHGRNGHGAEVPDSRRRGSAD